ncbi:glycosyltransferase family 4 protein [Proteiniclasticum sp.]|uniref:glycosyltransferase family 4 protein n=1 Tax=Proteiniclasticum sp. TaxID=2053595 RepID=UPI00289ED83D|nr:glycosyltransferase family 4 protein [Proteiniclasticum sp.]
MVKEENNEILVITPGYPSKDNPYNNSFVHQRVLGYLEEGIHVEVFSVPGSPYKKNMDKPSVKQYEIDGVPVSEGTHGNLEDHLKKKRYSKILVHFAWKGIMEVVLEHTGDTPLIIWVHGVEALSWKRRLFNLTSSPKEIIKFIGYIPLNKIQLRFVGRLIEKQNDRDMTFVFVSHWMKEILEEDTGVRSTIKKYRVIPNVINDKLFNYEEKDENLRYHIFNVRPYHSKKYANDLMVDTIIKLKTYKDFEKLRFNLYGDGRLFDDTVKPILGLTNVNIHKGMLPQKEIAARHKENGILLMPTRQDAQGVSMCEAMSSGLVPVVSDNTAIPEYVCGDCGYLCEGPDEMAKAIIELVENPDIFKEKSKTASKYIIEKCSGPVVLKEEVSLILKK